MQDDTKPALAIRSRCEPTRSLMDRENPHVYTRGPSILGVKPEPKPVDPPPVQRPFRVVRAAP